MHLSIPINEQELVKQCMAGEEKGYAMLYNKYAKRIYHAVFRVMGNTAESEDIVQAAFCTAFEQIDRLKNQNNFEGWVKRIALNQAISALRKRKVVFTEDSQLETVADEEVDINDELIFQCKIDDIKKAIADLPDVTTTTVPKAKGTTTTSTETFPATAPTPPIVGQGFRTNEKTTTTGKKAEIITDDSYNYTTLGSLSFLNSSRGTVINGKLNGGGEKIILKSTHGKIYLRK